MCVLVRTYDSVEDPGSDWGLKRSGGGWIKVEQVFPHYHKGIHWIIIKYMVKSFISLFYSTYNRKRNERRSMHTYHIVQPLFYNIPVDVETKQPIMKCLLSKINVIMLYVWNSPGLSSELLTSWWNNYLRLKDTKNFIFE